MYNIDKNIPIPTTRNGPRDNYPFPDMVIGDSFFVDKRNRNIQNIRSAACDYGKKHKIKFKITAYKQDNILGCRCWRVN